MAGGKGPVMGMTKARASMSGVNQCESTRSHLLIRGSWGELDHLGSVWFGAGWDKVRYYTFFCCYLARKQSGWDCPNREYFFR